MKILFVGHFQLSASTATSLRVQGLIRSLQHGHHDVFVMDVAAGAQKEAWRQKLFGLPRAVEGLSVDEYSAGFLNRAPVGVRGLFLGDVTCKSIEAQTGTPDAVVLSGTHLGYLLRLQQLCKSKGIPLILDVVEWYAPEDLPGGRIGPYAISNSLSMRNYSLRADGFIVISRRLEAHYAKSGRPTTLVRPIFPVLEKQPVKFSAQDRRLHLCYAGSPGRKEAMQLIFEGVSSSAGPDTAISLHLVGLTEEQVLKTRTGRSLLKRAKGEVDLICYGRVPNTQAQQIVAQSDYSLLIRPLRRSNQFGFPSKLAESMALGTASIANLFSDLGEFLIDEENAILLPELSPDALASSIKRAAKLSLASRQRMSAAALDLAREHFAADRYSECIDKLLVEVINRTCKGTAKLVSTR